MTNLKAVFRIVLSIYKLDKICDSTQSLAQPQSGLLSGGVQISDGGRGMYIQYVKMVKKKSLGRLYSSGSENIIVDVAEVKRL